MAYQKGEGCTKLYILNDKEVYGKGIADQVATHRQGPGPPGARQRRHRHEGRELPHARHEDQVVRRRLHVLRRHHPEQGRAGLHRRPCREPDGEAVRPGRRRRVALHLEDQHGGAEADVHHESDAGSEALPAGRAGLLQELQGQVRRGSRAVRDLRLRGDEGRPAAIQNAGDKGNDRQAVIDAFFKIKDRDSVLGKYSIDENGDTTLSDYGADRVEAGKLVFDKVLKAQGAA